MELWGDLISMYIFCVPHLSLKNHTLLFSNKNTNKLISQMFPRKLLSVTVRSLQFYTFYLTMLYFSITCINKPINSLSIVTYESISNVVLDDSPTVHR